MSSFVALPPLLEKLGLPRDSQWQAYLVTMLVAFVSVVPFIIYAEKHRQMKRVFIGCVVVMLAAELVLWQSGQQLGSARRVAALLHRLQRDGGAAAVPHQQGVPTGYKGPPWGLLHQSVPRGCHRRQSRGLLYSLGAAPGVWRLRRLALAWLGVSLTMAEPPT